jgi:hypothetical protein
MRSLQAEVGIPPLPLHIDGRQARFRLRSAESGIDEVVGEEMQMVRRFLSETTRRPRRTRTPRIQQNHSNTPLPQPPAADPAPLAAP